MRKRGSCCSSSACRSARTNAMATTAKIAKAHKTPKFKVRLRNRCHLCGRPRAYMRKFALCRLCFRKLALEGDVTGVTKSSWWVGALVDGSRSHKRHAQLHATGERLDNG